MAQVVAVEEVGRVAVLDEDALQLRGDRRLARGRQARQPDGRAARAERVPAVVALQAALVPGHAGRVLGLAAARAHAPHHAGGDGVVGVLVDQDERAGRAVLGVGVGDDRRGRAQRDPRDVVERQLVRRRAVGERRHVEQRVDRLDGRAHRARRVLERDVLARAQRLLGHPADVASIRRPLAGSSSGLQISSPRPTSRSSASCTLTESGGAADSSGPS